MKFAIDHKSHIPLHAQVEALIREMHPLPEYRDGKLLPNEVELAKQLGISRNTVRQATNKLVYEGILTRKKGVGTRFTETEVDTRLNNWLSFSQEMSAKGIQVKNYFIEASWVVPEKNIAMFLQIPEGTEVLKMDRLRGSSERPFVMFHSWFHPRIGLSGKEDFSRPLYELLEKDYFTIVKVSREEIAAVSADERVAQLLKVRKGDPILQRVRKVYDPGNRPVEYNIGFYRGDSFTYRIESER